MQQYQPKNQAQQSKEFFDGKLRELEHFQKEFGRFPDKNERPRLYSWMTKMKLERRKGVLNKRFIAQLDAIGFIWDQREHQWFRKAETVKNMLVQQQYIPSSTRDTPLYHWLELNLNLLAEGALPEDKSSIISEISRLIREIQQATGNEAAASVLRREMLWAKNLHALVRFRQEHPARWPNGRSADAAERKLAKWCYGLRRDFWKNILNAGWVAKLQQIGFSFERSTHIWQRKFDELEIYLRTHRKAPDRKDRIFPWACAQYKNFTRLTPEMQELLHSIQFFDYCSAATLQERWERHWQTRYTALRAFITAKKKMPTASTSPALNAWLIHQRAKYRKGTLSAGETAALLELGVDLKPTEKLAENWNKRFEALVNFMAQHGGRWPRQASEGTERKLYEWCETQRYAYKDALLNGKELKQGRIDKLNAIGFRWTRTRLKDRQ